MSELLLRAAEPTNQQIVGDIARQAVASLRGYAYQIYASALAWLDLPPGSEVHLEVAEDFALAADNSLNAVQVKYTDDTISLASKQARDAISAFVKLVADNPGRAVRLTLLTTSKVTTERNLEHRTGSIPGIERWRAAANGGDLADLREVLLRLEIGPDALAFIRERDDERLRRELLRRIEWRCGENDIGDLAIRFEDRVAEVCLEEFGVPLTEGPRHAAILLLHVLRTCTRTGSRACTHRELHAVLSSSTQVSRPRREYDFMMAAAMGGLAGSAVVMGAGGGWEAEAEIPLPADLIPRTDLVERISSSLRVTSVALIHAGSGMGKTALARLAARAVGERWNLLDLRNRSSEEAAEQLLRYARRPADRRHGLLADDVPDLHLMEEGSRLIRAVGMIVERGEPLILIGYHSPSSAGRRTLGLSESSVIEVPLLSVDEINDVVVQAGGDSDWARPIWVASRGGHPQLARALVTGLQERGWPTEERDQLLTEGAPEISEQLEATRRKLVRAVPDEGGRLLLHRLGLVVGRFPRKVAIALGAVAPAAPLPGERFDSLVGPWIDRVGSDRYRVSPLVAGSGDDVLPTEEVEAAHRAVAETLITRDGIDPDQIDNILVHGCAGGASEALLTIARLIITSRREMLASVAPFAPLLRAANTSRPILPTNLHVALMLRLAQTCLVTARGFGPEATRAARALIGELGAFDAAEKNFIEAAALGKLLFQEGFSSNVPEWPDLLLRFVQGATQAMSLPSSDGPHLRPLGPVLLSFNLLSLGSVAQLAEAFTKLSALGNIRTTLLGPMDGIVAPTVVVLSPWLKERDRGTADPQRAVQDYIRLGEMIAPWKQRDWSVALFVAAAEVQYQDLRDADAALAILASAETALGHDMWIDRSRQKILWGQHRDNDVISTVPTLKEVFRENSIELVGILREGAISASRLDQHALAAEWLSLADTATTNIALDSYRANGVGLAADAAAELWRGGNRREALEALSHVMTRLRDIDPETSLQAGFVHRVIRHAMLWFADVAGMGSFDVGGEAPVLPPGACSNPDPPAAILDHPLAPLDVGHYWLAQIAHAAGLADAVPSPHTRLSGKPILTMEVSIRKERLDRSILAGDSAAFLDALPPAAEALLAIPWLQENGRNLPLNEWKRGDFPPADPCDPKFRNFVGAAVFSFRLRAMAEGYSEASDTLQTRLAERDPIAGAPDLMFPEVGTVGSRSPEACLRLVGRTDLAPVDLLECCIRIGLRLDGSDFLPVVGPSFVRWAKREWLRIAEERRFSLRSPSMTAPMIAEAARQADEDIQSLARILGAAVPGIAMTVPEDFRRWIRQKAGVPVAT